MKELRLVIVPAFVFVLVNQIVLAQSHPTSASTSAPASQPAAPEGPKIVKMTVQPAPAPRPAFKYTLLPPLPELTEGNSAQLWYLATARQPNLQGKWDTLDRWRAMPPDQLPADEVFKLVPPAAFSPARVAARKNYCHWEYPVETTFMSITLMPLTEVRALGKQVDLLARVEIGRKHYDEAIRNLQVTFALGRDLDEGVPVIQGLVGIAVTALGLGEVEQIIQAPDSPNLYWALATLPRPTFRKQLEAEPQLMLRDFAPIADVRTLQLTKEQADERFEQMIRLLAACEDNENWNEKRARESAMAQEAKAREYLIALGEDRQHVESMPATQAVLAFEYEKARENADADRALESLPFPEAKKRFLALDQTKADLGPLVEIFPRGWLHTARQTAIRVQRSMAMLQTIEAIRAYAAEHNGQVPDTLDALTDMPAVLDPIFDRPFTYTRQGQSFVLEGLTPDPKHPSWTQRYEVTVKAK